MTLKPPGGPNTVLLGPVLTDIIYQGIGGADPTTDAPFQGTGQVHALSTAGQYHDSATHNIFHISSYATNDGTAPTVAVFGEGYGAHVWGGNFVSYAKGSNSAAIGIEIDFGNLDTVNPATSLVGLDLVSIGGNVNGVYPAASSNFIQITTNNPLSQMQYGIRFNAGTYQPVGTQTGTKITGTLASGSPTVTGVSPTTGYSNGDFITGTGIPAGSTISAGAGTSTLTLSANATATGAIGNGGAFIFTAGTGTLITGTGSNVSTGIDFSAATFSGQASYLVVNSGSTTASYGLVVAAAGGLDNAGSGIRIFSQATSSTMAKGIEFVVIGGRQPIVSSGSAINFGSVSTAFGLNLSGATFTTAGIAMGANNISTDTTTGMKIGTATGQKIGFWNATPVVRQALSYSRAGAGETAAGAALRSLLATIGLITDSTTA